MLYLKENGQQARGPASGPSSAPNLVVTMGKSFLFFGPQFLPLLKEGSGKGLWSMALRTKSASRTEFLHLIGIRVGGVMRGWGPFSLSFYRPVLL